MRRIRTVNKRRKTKEWKRFVIRSSFPDTLIIPEQNFKLFDLIRKFQEQAEKVTRINKQMLNESNQGVVAP